MNNNTFLIDESRSNKDYRVLSSIIDLFCTDHDLSIKELTSIAMEIEDILKDQNYIEEV